MKPLYQGLVAGTIVAALHVTVLVQNWTLWDVSIVSISGLSAGVFFILGMIFHSTVQDYKHADVEISKTSALLLSMQDMNIVAAYTESHYDLSLLQKGLLGTAQQTCGYIHNAETDDALHASVSSLIPLSQNARTALSGTQENVFMTLYAQIRESVSYLTYVKHHDFPPVGYVFLWFFASFIIALQLFSQTQNILLDTLFLFSLSAILVFFIGFIRDLDYPFDTKLACFKLDTRPLERAIATLSRRTEVHTSTPSSSLSFTSFPPADKARTSTQPGIKRDQPLRKLQERELQTVETLQ